MADIDIESLQSEDQNEFRQNDQVDVRSRLSVGPFRVYKRIFRFLSRLLVSSLFFISAGYFNSQ
jgi:hypothetical protein